MWPHARVCVCTISKLNVFALLAWYINLFFSLLSLSLFPLHFRSLVLPSIFSNFVLLTHFFFEIKKIVYNSRNGRTQKNTFFALVLLCGKIASLFLSLSLVSHILSQNAFFLFFSSCTLSNICIIYTHIRIECMERRERTVLCSCVPLALSASFSRSMSRQNVLALPREY